MQLDNIGKLGEIMILLFVCFFAFIVVSLNFVKVLLVEDVVPDGVHVGPSFYIISYSIFKIK